MALCLTSARFNMKADILRQGHIEDDELNPIDEEGEWVLQQHPDTGEIIRKWQENTGVGSGSATSETLHSFPCIARPIVDGGIRVAGTTERFGPLYEGVDYVRMTFPANERVSRRDRITNLRDAAGNILWIEEERSDQAPTIFNVLGVAPIVDPFGRHIENFALLERAEVQ